MASWKKGPSVVDLACGLTHMGVTTAYANAGECMLPCLGHWVRVLPRFDLAYNEGMITCVMCVMFVVHNGEISLWVPR